MIRIISVLVLLIGTMLMAAPAPMQPRVQNYVYLRDEDVVGNWLMYEKTPWFILETAYVFEKNGGLIARELTENSPDLYAGSWLIHNGRLWINRYRITYWGYSYDTNGMKRQFISGEDYTYPTAPWQLDVTNFSRGEMTGRFSDEPGKKVIMVKLADPK